MKAEKRIKTILSDYYNKAISQADAEALFIDLFQQSQREAEISKKALQKISKYGITPTSETETRRIRRLKGIADKALYVISLNEKK